MSIEAIYNRRSIRKYKSKEISIDKKLYLGRYK
ncbi:hypothetical protein CLRAG_37560 [Clostridium ragsdalei P11]|uniref:Uncharacterized protein n=1 Tax=Clostridium ragsdalei P11 TaxID=1353534 RepID=A0A1A6AJC2_9CLOT|nr:hypothetical protein CLRAG_37560 [Clostridium ragsdalei P11]